MICCATDCDATFPGTKNRLWETLAKKRGWVVEYNADGQFNGGLFCPEHAHLAVSPAKKKKGKP